MKEFYTQCLKDLYALTGIEQVLWMQRDLKDGKRNFDLCVAGMVEQSKTFAYIPEEAQQKIILKMMVEDKDYSMLNSRTVYKWLNMFKDAYFTKNAAPQETPLVNLTPEASARVDKLLEGYKTSLMDFRPKYSKLDEEKEKIQQEDSERVEGRHSYAKEYYRNKRNENLQVYNVDGIEIPARDEDHAKKQYLQAFGKEPETVVLKETGQI